MLRNGRGDGAAGRFSSAYSDLTSSNGGALYEASPERERGIMERTVAALSIPSIVNRCTELTKLLRTTHTLELREVYPMLLQYVFGWESSSGWRLRSFRRELSGVENGEIMKFLRPEGPLLDLTYRLMGDPNLRYEFPSNALPVGLQHKLLTSNDIPSFIMSKLSDRLYSNMSPSGLKLTLNPFELFFFHYAHAEIRQGLELTSSAAGLPLGSTITDSIYSDLLDEYLKYFLPTSDDPQIPNAIYGNGGKQGYVITPPVQKSNNPWIDESNLDPPTIFKASVFQSDGLHHNDQFHLPHHKNTSLDSVFWRTETFLNILISMWLSVDEDDVGYKFGTILPTVELVKSVRIIVRHWHLFSNIVSRSVDHPLEELRRNLFPLFQKKLYHFLRYIFPRWPLDTSFRIVYETWLSYIQPWRYSQTTPLRTADAAAVMDPSHQPWSLDGAQCNFVLENLPFYTTLFQHVLNRMSRADFAALRNAHMLYRITKIYCGIENLRAVLYETEKRILNDLTLDGASFNWHFAEESCASNLLDSSSFFASHTGGVNGSFNGGINPNNSFPNQPFVPSSLKVASVKQMMAELEGENFRYVPLFSKTNKDKVSELVDIISHILKLCEEPPPSSAELAPVPANFWSKVMSFFTSNTGASQSAADYSRQLEVSKTAQYLTMSKSNLVRLFNLPNKMAVESILNSGFEPRFGTASRDSPEASINSISSYRGNDETDYCGEGIGVPFVPRGTILSEYLDLLNGNPDLAHPTSYEIDAIVQFSIAISAYLNNWIVPWAEDAYFQSSWKSRICRAVLAKPTYYYDLRKLGPGKSIREKKYLPPRLKLRIFASSNMPYLLMIFGMMCWFFKISGLNLILVLSLGPTVYILLRAFFEPAHFFAEVRHEFSQANQTRAQNRRGKTTKHSELQPEME